MVRSLRKAVGLSFCGPPDARSRPKKPPKEAEDCPTGTEQTLRTSKVSWERAGSSERDFADDDVEDADNDNDDDDDEDDDDDDDDHHGDDDDGIGARAWRGGGGRGQAGGADLLPPN